MCAMKRQITDKYSIGNNVSVDVIVFKLAKGFDHKILYEFHTVSSKVHFLSCDIVSHNADAKMQNSMPTNQNICYL